MSVEAAEANRLYGRGTGTGRARRWRPILGLVLLGVVGVDRTRLEARDAGTKETKDSHVNLAFVLLAKAAVPKGEDVVREFGAFAGKGESLSIAPSEKGKASDGGTRLFNVKPSGQAVVGLIPFAVPKGEADEAAEFSLSSMGTGWKLPAHSAHLIVTFMPGEAPSTPSRMAVLSRFTGILAAVAKASGAVGIYWGNAGATHDPKFFLAMAAEKESGPRMTLWTGVSVASEGEKKISLLSLGMETQFGLPDLLLVTPKAMGREMLGFLFDLLAGMGEEGKGFPEGDTVGRSETEKIPVHYVASPVDSTKKVMRVELK